MMTERVEREREGGRRRKKGEREGAREEGKKREKERRERKREGGREHVMMIIVIHTVKWQYLFDTS